MPDPGSSGSVASAEAVVDANGEVVGLRITDRGSYFFGSSTQSSTIHSDFQNVEIDLDDGSVLSAKIIWQEDNTTGSYFVSGFEQLTTLNGQIQVLQPRQILVISFPSQLVPKLFLITEMQMEIC